MIEVETTFKLSEDRIRDLLTAAFEGGTNYWLYNISYELRDDLTISDFREGGKMQPSSYHHWCQLIPLVEGCKLTFEYENGEKSYLDRDRIKHGLQVMAQKYPEHFNDFISENEDADTGDVFIQCCTFGEITYG